MLVEIRCEEDLGTLESAILSLIGAQRLDASVLRSKPYIDMRQKILRDLHTGGRSCSLQSACMDELVLRVVSSSPILVWCDKRDVLPPDEDDSI
jgi:hypothetical protein